MKLSFSLSSKSSASRPPPSGASSRGNANKPEDRASASSRAEFVTEFDPNVTLGTDSSLPASIAPLPNTDTWRIPKRMKNLEPPPSSDVDSSSAAVADRFELETPNSEPGQVTYGLILRKNSERSDFSSEKGSDVVMRSEMALSAEQKLKEDIEKLPEDRGFEEFEDISVEDFSKALLAGYGWKSGQGIGRNAKEDTKVREYKRWEGNGGLGFKPDSTKKESSSKITQENGNSVEKKKKDRTREENKGGAHSWLRTNIKVKIISEEFKKGRFYLKKGRIMDVVGPMICDVSMDESGEILQGVKQEILETALPRRGGFVLVLYGRHKGCYGTLVEKDSKKDTALIKDEDSHEMIKVRLDQIAEYVGDPGVLGY